MISENKKAVLENYNKAREHYVKRNFQEALKYFRKCLEIDPKDGPSKIFADRCKDLIINPPPENWDGVYQMLQK